MKKMLIAGVAFGALIGPALAADMPLLKAPPPPGAYDWTGFYGEGGVGWAGNRFDWTYNPTPANVAVGEHLFPLSRNSMYGLGQVGFQKQWGWIVAGVEGSVGTTVNDNYAQVTSTGAIPVPACTVTAGQVCQVQTSGGTKMVGGKLGVAWNDWLFYGTGGGAWGEVQTQLLTGPTATIFDSMAQARHGWYAGAGFDYAVVKGAFMDFIVGVAYRHIDLGSGFITSTADAFSVTGSNARTITAREDLVLATVTLKLNPWSGYWLSK